MGERQSREKGKKGICLILFSVVSLFLLLMFGLEKWGTSAFAQEKIIELKYGSPYSPDHPFSVVDKRWFEKIEKETGGRVKIKPYWAGTLLSSREGVDEVVKGVVDIGLVHPSYAKAGYHIHKAMYYFFYGANQEIGRKVFYELLKKIPEIEREYQGLKVLAWTSGVDYQLLSRKPIRKIEDVKGMRVKITAELAEVFKKLGAEGVVVPMAETYEQMQKGILDAALISYEGLKSFRLAEVAKYLVILDFYRTHGGSRVINIETWRRLPDDIKKIFEANIEWWGLETDRELEKAHKEGIEFGKQMGVQFIKLSSEDMEKFYTPLKEIAKQKAEELDKLGLPGTTILTEAQKLIQQYKK
uniref:TRAP transporter substrate-binding protein n=1 Tax=candidate division WOR-3 bacterium TaxID=2052148 RepID=A0A7C2P5C1_UNCW3